MSYTITPASTKLAGVKAASKGFKVSWKKQDKQTTGYLIRYSISSKMKGAKTITITKNKTTSSVVKKLKAKKKYYVQICTYKKVGSKKICSGWSKSKTVTTKK